MLFSLRPLLSSQSLPFSHTLRTFSTTRTCPLSKIILIGRLATQPELVPTSTGRDIIRYTVGTNAGDRDVANTSWWRIAFTQKTETRFRDYLLGLTKGTLVYVEADAFLSKYANKDGQFVPSVNLYQRRLDVLKRQPGETTEGEQDQHQHQQHHSQDQDQDQDQGLDPEAKLTQNE